MCLRVFCGYVSLYIGCIFIGFTGMILAVIIFSVGLFELITGNSNILLMTLAMVFALIYALAKVFLLFGTMTCAGPFSCHSSSVWWAWHYLLHWLCSFTSIYRLLCTSC
ncbi:uncharacterized protein [Drosophila takahashii]|uniref:uncharacterized protein isoform X2 n=1 Tax=Drosophila takahashii TaxID=29030 RepID=UPI003899468C